MVKKRKVKREGEEILRGRGRKTLVYSSNLHMVYYNKRAGETGEKRNPFLLRKHFPHNPPLYYRGYYGILFPTVSHTKLFRSNRYGRKRNYITCTYILFYRGFLSYSLSNGYQGEKVRNFHRLPEEAFRVTNLQFAFTLFI